MVKILKVFGRNNVGPSSQTVAQHYFTIGSMYHVYPSSGIFRHTPSKHKTLRQCCFNVGPILKQHWRNVSCLLGSVTRMAVRANTGQSPNSVSMLGQRRIRSTGIKPAMGCDAGPTLNRYWVGRPTMCVQGTSYRRIH